MSTTTVFRVVALASAGVVIAATPAQAQDYGDDALQGLEDSPVYQAGNARFSNTEELESTFQGEGVAIVNLPEGGSGQLGTRNFAMSLNGSLPEYDTVIVVQEKSSFGVHSDVPGKENEILTSLHQNSSAGSGEAILASQDVITSAGTSATVEVSPDSPDTTSVDLGATSVLFSGIALAMLAIAVIAGLLVWLKSRSGSTTGPNYENLLDRSSTLQDSVLKGLPEETSRILRELSELREEYVARNQTRIADDISEVIKHTSELFKRVNKKSGPAKYQAVTIKYNDTLEKLALALGPEYYLDIYDKPRLWADSEKRMEEVRAALSSTDEQIIRNIQQVNANQDLEIKVALDSLARSMSTPALENIYNK